MNELQLKTTEMFGEVQTDIYENESHEMFMTIEQLGRCLGYASKNSIKSLISRNPYIKNEEFSKVVSIRASDGKRYNTRIFNKFGISKIISLSESNISEENKTELINKICPNYICTKNRKEIEFEEKLKNFLRPLNITGYTQYKIDMYRIDFYIPKLKLAIEYDENNHKYYDTREETKRESYLTSKLNCRFVRISNKRSDEYNMGIIAKEIINQIANHHVAVNFIDNDNINWNLLFESEVTAK